jgi:hypothetical protein
MHRPDIVDAIRSLRPGSQWVLRGGVLEWRGPGNAPNADDLEAEVARLVADWDRRAYQRAREAAYPAIAELVVALWEAVIENRPQVSIQLQTVRQTIKETFPKPS